MITVKKHAKIQYFKVSITMFFSETLNSQRYCDNMVYPFTAQLKEDTIVKAYFQQCVATAHTAHMSMTLLDDVFFQTESFLKPFGLQDHRIFLRPIFFSGVRWKTQCIRTIPTQLMSWRWPSQNTFGMWAVLYWTRSSRTQFGVSVNVWRLEGDTLKITCKFLCCNHQVHRDFLITLYN